jgi:peptidoglycan/LPS O-acetylase OafA/YrhL
LAVYTFFLISGMLVTASYARQNSAAKFVALRAARIYPAFFVCVLLSAYVIYPLFSSRGFSASVTSSEAWDYFAKNAALFRGTVWVLPGLFDTVALKNVVNGSLWTLPLEVKCYIIVFVLGIFGLLRWRIAILIGSIIAMAGLAYIITHTPSDEFLRQLANKPNGYSFYAPFFFVFGMLLYAVRDYVPIQPLAWLGIAGAYILCRNTQLAQVLFYLTLIYGVLCLAALPTLHRLRPKADLSYGVYLWAFPVQQIVASAWPSGDNLLGLCASVPLTLIIAAFSWYGLERPILRGARIRLDAREPKAYTDMPFTEASAIAPRVD